MGDSEHINETVETVGMLVVSAIKQLKKSKKRFDEHTILDYLQKKGNSINQQKLSLSIASLSKNGIIIIIIIIIFNSFKVDEIAIFYKNNYIKIAIPTCDMLINVNYLT